MRFRGAIFDLDGTLLDSMGMWDDIDVAFLSRRGLTVPDDYVQAIVPLSFRETAVYTIDRFGLTETPEAVMEEWMRMAEEAYAFRVEPKPYAAELLRRWKARGTLNRCATMRRCIFFWNQGSREAVCSFSPHAVRMCWIGTGRD